MTAWLLSLLARFKGVLLWVAGALVAAAAFYFKGRNAGKQVEQKKATERDLTEAKQHAETIRETSDVQVEVTRLPDDAVRDRLRDKWARDN